MGNTEKINTVEWFFGYGGNHIGLKRAGVDMRILALCEIEEFAIQGILEKMEDGRLPLAPIWNDCKTFPREPFKNRVDLFVASYPCQPFSAAGKRLGKEDPRHLWPYVYEFVRDVRPTQCFFENVEGHVTKGLQEVVESLEGLGYEVSWGIFSASETGAPHQRKRVFILANSEARSASEDVADSTGGHGGGLPEREKEEQSQSQFPSQYELANSDSLTRRQQAEGWFNDSEARSAGEELADSTGERTNGEARQGCSEIERQGGSLSRESVWPSCRSDELADSNGGRMCRGGSSEECGDDSNRIQSNERKRDELWGEAERLSDISRSEELANSQCERLERRLYSREDERETARGSESPHGDSRCFYDIPRTIWPSRPGEPQHEWEPPRTIDGKLNPDWVETLMGLPVGWTGTGNRVDRLRLLGNGVAPQTAEIAWKVLNA